MDRQTQQTILEKLHRNAAAAARLIGHFDDPIAVGPLGDLVDEIAHTLAEPHPIDTPVPSARPAFDDENGGEPTQVHARPARWSDAGTKRIEAVSMAQLVESGER